MNSILLVDDDELDRAHFKRLMTSAHTQDAITEASSIADAKRILAARKFDCLVLDYLLPEGPCLEFLAELRALAPGAAVIVLTGQGDERVAVELMKAGIADYLPKDGLESARLGRAVRYAVVLERAQNEIARADARQKKYAAELKHFAEKASVLAQARSIDALVGTAADVAIETLNAREGIVVIRQGPDDYIGGGGATNASAKTAAEWLGVLPETIDPETSVHTHRNRITARIHARDGETIGYVGIHACDDEVEESQKNVLCQLGVLIGVCHDNLLLFESAERATLARDEMMAVVSHDLRTPLSTIRLGADLLRANATQADASIIDRLDRSVSHMTRLVDDLVDMVRIETRTVDVALHTQTAAEIVRGAVLLVSPQVDAAGLRFDVEPPNPDLLVDVDHDRVQQVLANLLGNAVKFTPKGGTVSLSVKADDGRAVFCVRDTGCGIDPEKGSDVFRRSWRSDPMRRRGLGLGLYIAKGLVEAQHGRIWFDSKVGVGTAFYFSLPLAHKPGTVA